jgi:hypothetical protein
MSKTTGKANGPISDEILLRRSERRAARITRNPWAAKACAAARPIPLLAPVTRATGLLPKLSLRPICGHQTPLVFLADIVSTPHLSNRCQRLANLSTGEPSEAEGEIPLLVTQAAIITRISVTSNQRLVLTNSLLPQVRRLWRRPLADSRSENRGI